MGISPAIFTARPLRNFQARQNAAANRRAKYKKISAIPIQAIAKKYQKATKNGIPQTGIPFFQIEFYRLISP